MSGLDLPRYKVEYFRHDDTEPRFVGIYDHYEDALLDYKFYAHTGDVLIFVEKPETGDWVEVIVSISDQEDNSEEEEECDDDDREFVEEDEED